MFVGGSAPFKLRLTVLKHTLRYCRGGGFGSTMDMAAVNPETCELCRRGTDLQTSFVMNRPAATG